MGPLGSYGVHVMFISKVKKANELTRDETAFMVKLVKSRFGLKLAVKQERLYLSKRYHRGVLGAKLQVSRDETIGASLYWAKVYAKANRLGIYRERAKS